jgi:hypothetical protein
MINQAFHVLSVGAGVCTGSLTRLPCLCFSAVRHPEAGSKCKDIADGELAESINAGKSDGLA